METARTRLRRMQLTDFDNMRTLDSDPEVVRFTPSRVPLSEEQSRDRLHSQIKNQIGFEPFGVWLAEEKQTGEFLGWFMLLPTQEDLELGFMLTQKQWGRGFATEISRALIDFAKMRGIAKVVARTSLENVVSIRVLEKLGFQYTKNISVVEKGSEGEIELKFFELHLD